jgi:hypothetical protein
MYPSKEAPASANSNFHLSIKEEKCWENKKITVKLYKLPFVQIAYNHNIKGSRATYVCHTETYTLCTCSGIESCQGSLEIDTVFLHHALKRRGKGYRQRRDAPGACLADSRRYPKQGHRLVLTLFPLLGTRGLLASCKPS